MATALWCVHKAGGDFKESVLRGANSSGDSDSIACIAGPIAGAMKGIGGVPEEWVIGVEKPEILRALYDASTERLTGNALDARPLDKRFDIFGADTGERPAQARLQF